MKWQRARSQEQKEHRILEIVKATARLYEHSSFDEISLAMIAKEADFTRSNLYKYFSSKEEIFLEFLKQDIILWRKDIVKGFKERKVSSVKRFARIWTDILSEHRRLLDLLSIMNTYLEKNVSEETLVDFKRKIIYEIKLFSELLCGIFPLLDSKKASEFMELHLASAIGLYQITNLSGLQQQVLEYPEFRHMKINFKAHLSKLVECLLGGLMSK